MNWEKDYINQVSLAHRQQFAQFFTPETIAQIMIAWLLGHQNLKTVLEPAFGLGIFSRLLLKENQNIKITGFEIDPVIFATAKEKFNQYSYLKLYLKDYLFTDWENQYDGIICNPPYFKFHDYNNHQALTEIEAKLNIKLKGFTNIYALFLLKSIEQLKYQGRAVYLIPSEFLNADYGKLVKDYLLKSNTLRHIIIFDFRSNLFEEVLTTSAIILLAKDDHDQLINFSTVKNQEELNQLKQAIINYPEQNNKISFKKTEINPQLKWRIYYQKSASSHYQNLIPFNQIAKVVRGIATGANDYFIFNLEKAKKYQIPEDYLLPCITKSKDVTNPFFSPQDFAKLKEHNAQIFLLNVGKNPTDENVLNYLKLGEKNQIHTKYLTSNRKPWYLLEHRPVAPIWVGVFNRHKIKFILNEAQISNLTTFHGIYLLDHVTDQKNIDLIFAYLLTEVAQSLFNDHRREYADGLKKFEPNDLNQALMLNIFRLNLESKTEILNLYYQYKNSMINQQENLELIDQINKIFEDNFKF